MKKVYFILSLFILITVIGVANEYSVIQINNTIPEELFTSFGTRTKNVQIYDLTPEVGTNRVLAIKGWWFSPIDIPVVENTWIRLFNNGDEKASFKMPLTRSTMYRNVEPLLLVIPDYIDELELLGVSISFTSLKEEFGDLNYEEFPYMGKFMEKSVFTGKNVDSTFIETNYLEKQDSPVIVVAAGSKPTGGYSLSITRVTLNNNLIEIEATLTAPSKDSFVIQAFTFPSAAIMVEPLPVGQYQIQVRLITLRDEKLEDEEFLATTLEIR